MDESRAEKGELSPDVSEMIRTFEKTFQISTLVDLRIYDDLLQEKVEALDAELEKSSMSRRFFNHLRDKFTLNGSRRNSALNKVGGEILSAVEEYYQVDFSDLTEEKRGFAGVFIALIGYAQKISDDENAREEDSSLKLYHQMLYFRNNILGKDSEEISDLENFVLQPLRRSE